MVANAVTTFVAWVVLFSPSEKRATPDQPSRARNRETPA
jgi:hypothetical protein